MPHKPSRPVNSNVTFVSVSLTVELKHTLANWAADNKENLVSLIADAAQSGYRVSVKEENDGYSANLAPVRENNVNKGLLLMERASSPERALLRLLWAHYSHYKLVWPHDKTAEGDDW